MAAWTLARVRSLTCAGLLIQRETVAIETPAISATCLMDTWANGFPAFDFYYLRLIITVFENVYQMPAAITPGDYKVCSAAIPRSVSVSNSVIVAVFKQFLNDIGGSGPATPGYNDFLAHRLCCQI